ncbi:MAG: SUMF1/EgtB/PvdO family nonheme iron enzyme [Chloroflexota bacterium]
MLPCFYFYKPAPRLLLRQRTGSDRSKRVIRGGSWYNDASAMRVAARSSLNLADAYDTVGFRCVLP